MVVPLSFPSAGSVNKSVVVVPNYIALALPVFLTLLKVNIANKCSSTDTLLRSPSHVAGISKDPGS